MPSLAYASEQKLGQILIERNQLTEQSLTRVLSDQQKNRTQRLGD